MKPKLGVVIVAVLSFLIVGGCASGSGGQGNTWSDGEQTVAEACAALEPFFAAATDTIGDLDFASQTDQEVLAAWDRAGETLRGSLTLVSNPEVKEPLEEFVGALDDYNKVAAESARNPGGAAGADADTAAIVLAEKTETLGDVCPNLRGR